MFLCLKTESLKAFDLFYWHVASEKNIRCWEQQIDIKIGNYCLEFEIRFTFRLILLSFGNLLKWITIAKMLI